MTTCPKCGSDDLNRDEVDVAVGVIYGPYGCACGWSEWPEFDRSDGTSWAQQAAGPGRYVDSCGRSHSVDRIAEGCARFGISPELVESVFST